MKTLDKKVVYYFNMALTSIRKNQPYSALRFLKKGLTINANSVDLLDSIAYCYYVLEKPEKSVKYLKKIVNLNIQDPDAFFHLGKCYESLGKKNYALHYFKKAYKINPNNAEYVFELGKMILLESQDFEKSLKLLKRAYFLNPTEPEINSFLGYNYLILNKFRTSIKYFHRIEDIYEDKFKVYFSLSYCYTHLNDVENAIKYSEMALKIKKKAVLYINLAELYNRAYRIDDAMNIYIDCVIKDPKYGKAFWKNGFFEENNASLSDKLFYIQAGADLGDPLAKEYLENNSFI